MLCRYLTLPVFLICVSCITTNFLSVDERSDENWKVFELDLEAVSVGVYATKMTVGTPPQSVYVSFDTGSSDSWIRSENSACEGCENSASGYLDVSKSSSFKSRHKPFSVIYGSGEVNGTWAKEDFKLAGKSIKSFKFGVAKSLALQGFDVSLIGLGLEGFESTNTFTYGILHQAPNTHVTSNRPFVYPNFPTRLRQEGVIKKTTYSVYYPAKLETSKLIFGGVDSNKYDSLITIPIIQRSTGDWSSYKKPVLLAVSLDQISLNDKRKSYPTLGKSYPALLDTLTYTTYAPRNTINNILTLLGGTYDTSLPGIIYKCSKNINVDFTFSGSTLSVSLLDLSEQEGNTCFLPISPSPDDYIVLGSAFLSSFYTHFDLEVLEIGIGNYVDKGCSKLSSSARGIPNSKRALQYDSTFRYSSSDINNYSYINPIKDVF